MNIIVAVVLICAADLSVCDATNARVVMRVPGGVVTPYGCEMLGQAYLAGTSFGRDLATDERVKIMCERRATR